MPGALYLVSTPIGNLEDITYRAVRVLREVDRIACEDTRRTRKLLERYGIRKPLVSFHEHNERERAVELAAKLAAGETVALVSDAGTPLVSDPGYRLVARAIEAGIAVVPVPGPSAALAALACSGLPTDCFRFGGFLPAKSSERRRVLEGLRGETATLVFYEAPHRVLHALEDIQAVLGARPMTLARELTKIHEEFLRGTPEEISQLLSARPVVKGEITLLIGKGAEPDRPDVSLREEVEGLVQGGASRMEAIQAVARRRGLPKREVYKTVEEES
jgi:16S rRNA (cytidine1402-2'-O)-methyltransferase